MAAGLAFPANLLTSFGSLTPVAIGYFALIALIALLALTAVDHRNRTIRRRAPDDADQPGDRSPPPNP